MKELGYITKIRCNPKHYLDDNAPEAKFDGAYRDYHSKQYSAKSWYVRPQAAIKMIEAIEMDEAILEQEKRNARQEDRDIQWPFKYQKAGASRWSFLGGNGGHNCLTWAEEKLAIAGAGNRKLLTDSSKASTEIHITCLVQ